jgi:acetyl esterase/lipase
MPLKSFLKNKYIWLAAIIAAFLLRFSSGYFSDSVKMYTDSKIKNFANEIINESIRRELLATTDFSDILIESYDANGKVSYAYLNSNKVNKIKCPLLIISGTADDNVHMSNTMSYVSSLIENGKYCDLFLFPDMNHSINGCNSRAIVYAKMLDYFNKNLKK